MSSRHDHAVGIDLGATTIKAALVKREEGLSEELALSTEADQGPEHIIDRIARIVRQLTGDAPAERIAGVGIGSPGAINWERTTVTQPPNMPGWETVNLRDALQERLDFDDPVLVENDASAAGLGSAHYGAGRPFPSFIMVTLGTGVGGAIIYQDRIFRGSTGGAAELGHMTIDYEGPVARSGVAGAIEAYLGHRFLSRHARDRLRTRATRLHDMTEQDLDDLTPKMLHEAAEQGDEPAREMLAWAGHKLGCALGSTVNLLDIRKVVVGGGISQAGDYLLDPAREALPRYVMPGLQDDLDIVQETLGNEVGMLGAAHLVFAHQQDHDLSTA
ncbi:MAG: ROK family protein [Bacteroidetes bacterium QS_8_64_10]|nr:MAG: ROK family protein [Bacteroidetes bacterium QS_8_64_10]